MDQRNNIYFASDFHLGIPDHASSLEREKKIVRWLYSIENDAKQIFLVGDLFDFWFEYKHVVPKGYVRLLGKLANLKDKGIDIQVFTGNHDLWMFDYFEKELNIPVHRQPITFEENGKKFFVGHGDGIGPGDKGYKLMKRIFTGKFNQWVFSLLHPRIAFSIANYFSHNSRSLNEEEQFLGEEKEWQILFAKEKLKKEHFDYFIFGHRHIALQIQIGNNTTFINLGDWVKHSTYAVFNGEKTELKYFEE
ncbi:MAG: UDP-2,3-diacylglucosamine diphosphatase [Fimbriimonadaceae bacterium]|nr:UDP-2,3-diacylglucosamine diphosphatase [Chitinophagales bacterium]